VPQKAQSKLDPSSDFSVRLYRVSGKAQPEHNQVQKEGEMVSAAVMDFGSVSSFRSGRDSQFERIVGNSRNMNSSRQKRARWGLTPLAVLAAATAAAQTSGGVIRGTI
jgi:hypothetical protein